MTEINLIPWRHIQKERERREIVIISIFILLVFAGFFWEKNDRINAMINNKKMENHLLQEKLIKQDTKIKELTLINQRKDSVETMFEKINRSKEEMNRGIFFLKEITKIIPEDMYLESIEIKKRKIMLIGYSAQNHSISNFIKALDKNPCMKKAILMNMIKNEEAALIYKNEFRLSLLLDGKIKDCCRDESKTIEVL